MENARKAARRGLELKHVGLLARKNLEAFLKD
jgi:hypothetical protein